MRFELGARWPNVHRDGDEMERRDWGCRDADRDVLRPEVGDRRATVARPVGLDACRLPLDGRRAAAAS